MPVVTSKACEALGVEIQRLRKKRGFSREMLAGLADVSLSTVVRIEAGHVPRVAVLGQVADVLGATREQVGKLVQLAAKD